MMQKTGENIPASQITFIRILRWITVFCVVAVAPYVVFSHLIGEFQVSVQEERNSRAENETNALMTQVEENMEPVEIFAQLFHSFERRAARLLGKSRSFGPKQAAFLTKDFKKVRFFPKTSTLVWFDADQNLIQPTGEDRIDYFTSWPRLLKLITSDEQASEIDEKRAGSLITKTMGKIVTIDLLRHANQKPLEIFFKKRPHFFGILRFPQAGDHTKTIATLIAMIPQEDLPPGWKLAFAMRKLGNPKYLIGGFWQSTQTGFGQDILNVNLLQGISKRWLSGEKKYAFKNFFFHSHPWSYDQDLLLVVGVKQRSDEVVNQGLNYLKTALLIVAFLSGLFFLGVGTHQFQITLSLATKFFFGSLFLVLIPLSFVAILGMDHLENFTRVSRSQKIRVLNGIQQELEQSFNAQIASQGRELKQLLKIRPKAEQTIKKYLEKRFSAMKSYGLEKYFYLSKSGLYCMEGLDEDQARKGADSVLKGIIKLILRDIDFPLPPKIFTGAIPMQSEKLYEGIFRPGLLEAILDSWTSLEFGGNKWMIFLSIEKDISKRPYAFLTLTMAYSPLRDFFLKNGKLAISKPDQLIFLQCENKKTPPKIRELIHRADRTKRDIVSTVSLQNNNWIVLARHLKELETVIATAIPVSDPRWTMEKIGLVIVILSFLSLLVGHRTSLLMNGVLLAPVLSLTEKVVSIQEGHLEEDAISSSIDESGRLGQNFNSLLAGLREKALMAPFLQRDLLTQLRYSQSPKVERIELTILFAGIRNFQKLEAFLPLEDSLSVMNHFLSLCELGVKESDGSIDKFIGDTAMAIFRDSPGLTSREKAVKAALVIRQGVFSWLEEREEKGRVLFRFGIGIASGSVVAGSVGSLKKRLDFTVIGDSVNLAARLEKIGGSANHNEILIAGKVSNLQLDGYTWKKSEETSIRGKTEKVEIWELGPELK